MFMKTLVLVTALSLSAAAAKTKSVPTPKRLDQATGFLKATKVTKLDVEKTVVSDLLGKTTSSKGEIVLGKGKFRWETTSPEKSLVVFDGKTLWTLQQPIAELGGPAQVTKSQVSGKARDQILVKMLSGGKLSQKFRVQDAIQDQSETILRLSPVKPDPNVKDFSVVLGGKPEKLHEIRYGDEVGNQTTIRILGTETVKKPAKDLFKFEVPKGAEVNEL